MHKYGLFVLVLSSLFSFQSSAEEGTEKNSATKGLEIAMEAKERDTGWQDVVVEMKMTLRNSSGQEAFRSLRSKTIEGEIGNKSLTIIDLPRDVKGTSFLNHEHPQGVDDQWIYLPSLSRVKRIASKDRSGPFMGSEFSYEDMSSLGNIQVAKYDYHLLREDQLNGQDCYVLEVVPKDEYSGYSKFLVWYDKQELRRLQVEFYDRKSALLKTLTLTDYVKHGDQFWRAQTMLMVNHINGKSTDINWSNFKFGNGLGENEFTKGMLKRKF